MDSEETPRKMLDKALKGFRTNTNPDERLSNAWIIGQLIENTTDAELYELAAVVATDEDHRLRGEICYAVSRSRRPQFANVIKDMAQDKNQYVRKEALIAISELNEINNVKPSVIEPFANLVNNVNELKSMLIDLQKDIKNIQNNIVKPTSSDYRSVNIDEIIMNDRTKCWETYLRNEKQLLQDHKGEFVAIYNAKIVGVSPSDLELANIIHDNYGAVEAFIYKIEEEDEEPIQMPSYMGNIVEI